MKPKIKNKPEHGPISINAGGSTPDKMKAIVALSEAVKHLSIALTSINTTLIVRDCSFTQNSDGASPMISFCEDQK